MNTNWRFDVSLVSPEYAAELLSKNDGNRRIRPSVVAKYATIIREGNWILTPEPIVIADTGRLLNGQHRLHAVIQCGISVPFLVIRNVSESVFSALDRGAIRSTADALGADPKAVEVGKAAARVMYGSNASDVTDARVAALTDILADEHNALISACNTTAKVMSAASVRAAACIRMLAGYDVEYITGTYRNLVLANLSSLDPLPQSFFAAVAAGRIYSGGGSAQIQLTARAWDLFDPAKRANTRIFLRDERTRLDAMRAVLKTALDTHGKAMRAAA